MDYMQMQRALDRLEAMLCRYEAFDGRDALILEALRESVVQRFEYTLETAWKTCKRHLSEQGFMEAATGSPKSVMRLAFSCGLIRDAAPWLQYIDARRNTAHDYSEAKLNHVLDLVEAFFRDAVALYETMSGEKRSICVAFRK